MADTIANAVVQIAKLAVIAFAIAKAQPVLLLWVERIPVQPTDEQIVDAARKAGIEVRA
jgi:hypothetical protein